MRSFVCFALLASLCSSVVAPLYAHAECYGEAATMYGCGVPGASQRSVKQGSLEYFGDSRAPVLPNVGDDQNSSGSDDVITPQERRRMLRSIVLGGGRRTYSQRSHIQAINNAGSPIRRTGSVRQVLGR